MTRYINNITGSRCFRMNSHEPFGLTNGHENQSVAPTFMVGFKWGMNPHATALLDKMACYRTITYFAVIIMLIAVMGGCASTKVERVRPEETIDLSGRWNDTDSRLVAEAMIKDSLSRPWLENYVAKNRKQPTVIVGTVVNRSHEHISVQTFIKDLERELTNSGQVRFVASAGERSEIREERTEQMIHATEETAKGVGKEIGADYMLKGVINTIQDEEKGTKVVYYQINLEMIDIESNIKVWLGDKKIKKVVERRRLGF